MISRSARVAASATAIFAMFVWHSGSAHACGGCFHPPTQNASVITDHRMALSVSTTQTVLWDQIRYSGSPQAFAWVLPVGQGARIELARDEWLTALDVLTGPTISAPYSPCGGGGGGGGGCGASDAVSYYGGAYDATAGMFDSGDGVQVVSQEVVGPYDAVTIHSSSGEAISLWLTDNGFDIPSNIQPILDAYTTEGFDFIALRLAPNEGVQAMQPVRVITPGADPTLPLRMVSAGIGSSVGLTLYVIAEGRYESSNFPALLLDRSKIVWDPYAQRSNYTQLFDDTVTAGKGWVTEFSGGVPALSSTYKKSCMSAPPLAVPCASEGGAGDASAGDANISEASAGDANISEASADDANISEASADDASGEAGDDGAAEAASDASGDALDASTNTNDAACVDYVSACTLFTDDTVAMTGMAPYDVWVTRLRTTLPSSSLAVDLKLAASVDQSTLTSSIQAKAYTDPRYDPCSTGSSPAKEGCGCETAGQNRVVVPVSLAALALVTLARRRRRRGA